jgi:nitrate ABC transporter permease subunit
LKNLKNLIKNKKMQNQLKPLFLQKQVKQLIPSAVGFLIFVCFWYLLSLQPDTSLPSPAKVISNTWELIIDPFFYKGNNNKGLFWLLLASLKRVAIGYLLAALVGIPIGFIISLNQFLKQAIEPIIQLLRPVAPLAWLPLAQAIFLKPNPSAIFVIFVTAIWPIILNTALGVQLIPRDYIDIGRMLQMSFLKNLYKILLPATLPYIFTGLRISLGLSWLAVVAAEMLLSDDGLGFFIVNAYNNSDISEIILAIFYLGFVGIILDKLMTLASSKWQRNV